MTSQASTITTQHIHCQDIPYVEIGGGVQRRIVRARVDEGMLVSQVLAQPRAASLLHRHLAPVSGFTTEGAWGHDDRFLYTPGTYVFEPPGVVHQFLNGDAVSSAVFISFGSSEWLDPQTLEVVGSSTPKQTLAGYFEACESQGLPRPNLLM
jgi:2,4'-dihydroxyacetophenone dioxygenase